MKQVINTEAVPIKTWLDEIDEKTLEQAKNPRIIQENVEQYYGYHKQQYGEQRVLKNFSNVLMIVRNVVFIVGVILT